VEHFWIDLEIIEVKMRLPICSFFKWVGALFPSSSKQYLEDWNQFYASVFGGEDSHLLFAEQALGAPAAFRL
jgi:hypothetical protein